MIRKLLTAQHKERYHCQPEEALIQSWENSALAIGEVLQAGKLFEQFVVMEHCITYQENEQIKTHRMDFLLMGRDRLNQNNLIVIETKQWEKVSLKQSSSQEHVLFQKNGILELRQHPSYQAEDYAVELMDQLIERKANEDFLLSSFAYLHNIHQVTPEHREVLFDPKFDEIRNSTPLYTGKYRPALIRDLRFALRNGNGFEVWKRFQALDIS